jgi:hypothetical protein
MSPLDFGKAEPAPNVVAQLGGEVPPESVVKVSLMTPLDSATDHVGSPVRGGVTTLFSSDHRLILPAGARLEGSVTRVAPARRLHRNSHLRFTFRRIEVSTGAPRQIEASLQESTRLQAPI